jgi:hypothetical protein
VGQAPCFGDNVRIVATPLTAEHGLAGAAGAVYGETTPSVTGVDVIGVLTSDYALNVYFADRDEGFWFAPELVEFVDHAPGSTMSLDLPTGRKSWRRAANGEWIEESAQGGSDVLEATPATPKRQKLWWRLWRRP